MIYPQRLIRFILYRIEAQAGMSARKQLKLTDLFSKDNVQKSSLIESNNVDISPLKHKLPQKLVSVPVDAAKKFNSSIIFSGINQKEPNEAEMEATPLDCSFLDSLTDAEWRDLLQQEIQKRYMREILCFLQKSQKNGVKVFPPRNLIFNAFNSTPFSNIRVVLIGQDPYHNDNQAHGLCFSVPKGEKLPPSLKNIYKELADDIPGFESPSHGCLDGWAVQGVFMLNATLTVEAHKANSHSTIGWQKFTDAVIRLISDRSEKGVVFLLWGGFAHKKDVLVDNKKHIVIKTAHPSPLSYQKFKGCRCFSKTNEALIKLKQKPIDWAKI